MAAQLLVRSKVITADGAIIQLTVWRVPQSVPPSDHEFKYSAVYVVNGVRIVGFDNERGKGDHCHLDGVEVPYAFTSVEKMTDDFIAAIAARRTS